MPRNPGSCRGYAREARPRGLPTDSATENIPPNPTRKGRVVRVKRWGKSPPRQAQARRHGKPHREQGQIGDLSGGPPEFRLSERVPGMAAQRNGPLSPNSATRDIGQKFQGLGVGGKTGPAQQIRREHQGLSGAHHWVGKDQKACKSNQTEFGLQPFRLELLLECLGEDFRG
jgi:hypothetical protein